MPQLSLPCAFLANHSFQESSYYGIGGSARFFAWPESLSELADLLLWNREHRLPLAVMGSGSNILFSDEEFPGVVISLSRMQKLFWVSRDELFCEAGVENTRIAEELFSEGKGGGEWLYRLPGQIGATVRMNGRCFGGEVSTITAGILTSSVDGCLRWRLPDEVFHGYKQTSLMEHPEIVVAVLLRFPLERSQEEIDGLMQGYEEERNIKHHFDFPSCGSTFKNNYTLGRSSGRIFEELGFKGEREGGAMVSEHHANFIFNRNGATAQDVLRLAARMRGAALASCGAELELEVQCVGLFSIELLQRCGVRFQVDPVDSSKGWAGLLWAPQEEGSGKAHFPRTLLQGPMVGYSAHDREFPPELFVEVEQLVSLQEGAAHPEKPLLRWTTRRRDTAVFALKPPSSVPEGSFTDQLWHYGVSELFIGDGASGSGYLEFEMTPEAHWVALRFDAPRIRSARESTLSRESWRHDVQLLNNEACFGMEFSYGLLQPFIRKGVIRLQCSASSGSGQYGLFPWWKEPSLPADFHQPASFFRVALS